MILTHSYFVGELLIAGIAGLSSAHLAGQAELDWFIAVYEKNYLKLLLGDEFGLAFIADREEETPVYDTLKDLIYQTEPEISPVAGYVYYHFMKNANTQTGQLNQVRTVSENATVYNNFDKMVNAWNMMVDLSREIWDYLTENSETYPLFDTDSEFPFNKINTCNL